MIDPEQPDPTGTRSPTGTATKGTTPTGSSSASPTQTGSPTPSPTDAPTPSPSPTQSPSPTATSSPTPIYAPDTTYSFGEWHSIPREDGSLTWNVTVTSLDLKTTYSLDDSDEVYEMPEGEQLVVAHFLVKHSGNDINSWGATNLAILYGRTAYSPFFAPHSTHPEFPDPIGSDPQKLDSVAHQEQYQAEALTVGPDEHEDLWLVTVLPREAGRADLQVGYEDDTRDNHIYPIRWEPSVQSKATPSSTSTGEWIAGNSLYRLPA